MMPCVSLCSFLTFCCILLNCSVGFDIRGDIKIFDFGLSKEINFLDKDENGAYKLTGFSMYRPQAKKCFPIVFVVYFVHILMHFLSTITINTAGSPRYMAPEVALEKPYNGTCDSYSFAIMLWQMLALRTPFELYTMKSLKAKVWQGGKRPAISPEWPNCIKLLLKSAWEEDLSRRNSMVQIATILRKECARCRDGDESGLEHNHRRSTFVFRPSNTPGGKKRTALTAQ
jgi:serine/threonine protein kinase